MLTLWTEKIDSTSSATCVTIYSMRGESHHNSIKNGPTFSNQMNTTFNEVCIGNSLVLNGLAGVKVSTRTAEFITGEDHNGHAIWTKQYVKQKEIVRIADPFGNGIVLTF